MSHQFGLDSARWSFFSYWMCFLMHLHSNIGHLESTALQGWLSSKGNAADWAICLSTCSRLPQEQQLGNDFQGSFPLACLILTYYPKGQNKLHSQTNIQFRKGLFKVIVTEKHKYIIINQRVFFKTTLLIDQHIKRHTYLMYTTLWISR